VQITYNTQNLAGAAVTNARYRAQRLGVRGRARSRRFLCDLSMSVRDSRDVLVRRKAGAYTHIPERLLKAHPAQI